MPFKSVGGAPEVEKSQDCLVPPKEFPMVGSEIEIPLSLLRASAS